MGLPIGVTRPIHGPIRSKFRPISVAEKSTPMTTLAAFMDSRKWQFSWKIVRKKNQLKINSSRMVNKLCYCNFSWHVEWHTLLAFIINKIIIFFVVFVIFASHTFVQTTVWANIFFNDHSKWGGGFNYQQCFRKDATSVLRHGTKRVAIQLNTMIGALSHTSKCSVTRLAYFHVGQTQATVMLLL